MVALHQPSTGGRHSLAAAFAGNDHGWRIGSGYRICVDPRLAWPCRDSPSHSHRRSSVPSVAARFTPCRSSSAAVRRGDSKSCGKRCAESGTAPATIAPQRLWFATLWASKAIGSQPPATGRLRSKKLTGRSVPRRRDYEGVCWWCAHLRPPRQQAGRMICHFSPVCHPDGSSGSIPCARSPGKIVSETNLSASALGTTCDSTR